MLPFGELTTLAKNVAKMKPSMTFSADGKTFSYDAMQETLRKELNEYTNTNAKWRENKNKVFALIEEVLTEIKPMQVLERYGDFAETKVYNQGDKPIFTRKLGKTRAKQFITRVGLAGVYEVFKLDETHFEVQTSAVGGAVQYSVEEFLDGRIDFVELLEILAAGTDEFIYREIAAALVSSIDQLPGANKVSTNVFNEAEFDKLIAIASAYGRPTIYCTYEFATKMVPQNGWVSDSMKDQIWAQGYLANYKGCQVILLPQSFEDETNTQKVIDPSYCWIIPTGSNDKPVKIAFEGGALVKEVDNEDWSKEFRTYQKIGVGVIMTNNICCYVDTSLSKN